MECSLPSLKLYRDHLKLSMSSITKKLIYWRERSRYVLINTQSFTTRSSDVVDPDVQAEGGIIDGADIAAYLLFDRTTIHLHRDLLERMGKYQVPVSIQWAKDSMRLGSIQPLDPYRIAQVPAPPLQPAVSIGSKRTTPEATQAEPPRMPRPALKRPKTTLESSDTINPSSAAVEQPAPSTTSANGQSVPARRQSIGQKHKNSVKQRVEGKIQELVKVLAAWADNGCPTYRFTYLSNLPPLEVSLDH
jgi:hypothetical protein